MTVRTTILLFLMLLLSLSQIRAQSRTFIRYTIGYSFDRSVNSVQESSFKFTNGINEIFGGIIEQEIGRKWSVEAGIAQKRNAYDGYYTNSDGSEIIASVYYVQFPLRVKYHYRPLGERFSLSPSTGISYLRREKAGYGSVYVKPGNGLDLQVVKTYSKNLLLFELGLAFQYDLGKRWKLGLESAYYFSGNNKALAEYKISNKAIQQKISPSFLSIQLGIGFAFIRGKTTE